MSGILQALLAANGGQRTTWNPLDKAAGIVLSNGNLTVSGPALAGSANARSTTSKTTGKWHAEFTCGTNSVTTFAIGLANISASLTTSPGNANSIIWTQTGTITFNSGTITTIESWTNGSVLAIEFDKATGDVWFQKSGSIQHGPFNVAALTGAWFLFVATNNGGGIPDVGTANFGASAFTIAPTSGFSAWNSG